MADNGTDSAMKQEKLESEVREMKLKEEEGDVDMDTVPVAMLDRVPSAAAGGGEAGAATGTPRSVKKGSRSPSKPESDAQSPAAKSEEDTIGGDVELRLEADSRPKLVRTKSRTVARRPPPLFFDYEDKTSEATSTFSILTLMVNGMAGTIPNTDIHCDENFLQGFAGLIRGPCLNSDLVFLKSRAYVASLSVSVTNACLRAFPVLPPGAPVGRPITHVGPCDDCLSHVREASHCS